MSIGIIMKIDIITKTGLRPTLVLGHIMSERQ